MHRYIGGLSMLNHVHSLARLNQAIFKVPIDAYAGFIFRNGTDIGVANKSKGSVKLNYLVLNSGGIEGLVDIWKGAGISVEGVSLLVDVRTWIQGIISGIWTGMSLAQS